MLENNWVVLLGVPIIVALAWMAWRRARALAARIAEVQEDMARNPQNPYQALATLWAEQDSGSSDRPAARPPVKKDTGTPDNHPG